MWDRALASVELDPTALPVLMKLFYIYDSYCFKLVKTTDDLRMNSGSSNSHQLDVRAPFPPHLKSVYLQFVEFIGVYMR